MTPSLRERLRERKVPLIRELRASNFRCFRDQQRVPLAPVTMLVGENSTGKTSLLALFRVLWDMAFQNAFPNFKEPPYDLGSFDEIAHYRGGRAGRAREFSAGFTFEFGWRHHFDTTFARSGASPVPVKRRIGTDDGFVEVHSPVSAEASMRVGLGDREWHVSDDRLGASALAVSESAISGDSMRSLEYLLLGAHHPGTPTGRNFSPCGATNGPPSDKDLQELLLLAFPHRKRQPPPFAGAPVRSEPRRTYDPSPVIRDPEGTHVPQFLADIARRDPEAWRGLKSQLADFGRQAGLFDKIEIRHLDRGAGGPFQVQVRRPGKRAKGPMRNLVDMGYGVSQVLPVLAELMRSGGPAAFLLQQPEVHLHPSAQAALGSFFCRAAADGRQLLIETHSDHLIDRIRMDVRDGKHDLGLEDISLLYFERKNLSVSIHALGWDQEGNLVSRDGGIPPGYRDFFRTERHRSLGL